MRPGQEHVREDIRYDFLTNATGPKLKWGATPGLGPGGDSLSGMGGMHVKRGGYVTPSKIFMESLSAERGIHWITREHVRELGPGVTHYETIEGARAGGCLRLRDAAVAVHRGRRGD